MPNTRIFRTPLAILVVIVVAVVKAKRIDLRLFRAGPQRHTGKHAEGAVPFPAGYHPKNA